MANKVYNIVFTGRVPKDILNQMSVTSRDGLKDYYNTKYPSQIYVGKEVCYYTDFSNAFRKFVFSINR